MRVFLTGATGFIGSHVLRILLRSNHEVVAHRRKLDSKPKIEIDDPITWLTKSFKDLCEDDFENIDVLLHLASHSVQYPFDNLENNIKYNVIEPLEVFQKAIKAGISNLVVTGSCSEYGKSGERLEFIPTEAPLEPTDNYGTSKAMSYLAFRRFAENNQINFTYLRLFHVFGPGESTKRLWPSLKEAAIAGRDFDMTKGEQVRNFTYVEDMASLLINECENIVNNSTRISVKNLGSGRTESIREFAEYWWLKWEAKGKINFGKIEYRPNEIMSYLPKL